ncbi:DUF5686 and carboxypeptidase regulatory-like domain-containing protein [Alistipes sp. ZOR0009]|uniref:DUF5686 and carboxypeptidase regulatory-like domain-containing protein n=1 Tax=Alistipes sp. ZOR0009 TaxID=1339253 RepID=UPI0006483542|nr:DUF5686 and carboxypeptidase regulatory-like domain-containing protein [Alistipes sp. ZOR0009]
MLRWKVLSLLFILSTPFLSFSQRIVGKVTDNQGNPVPFATIFVKEMSKGLSANDKGLYQIYVEPGTFTVKFQSIGFKASLQEIKVGNKDVTLNVQLEEAVYNLSQVTVSSKDNPALWIIRKSIALGQQYKRSVAAYNSDIYIKGSFNVRKYSRLLKYMTPKSIDIPKEGKTYFAEMFTKVNFNAPDTYSQRIVSFRSTLPGADSKDNFPGLEFLNTSIYDNSFSDIPSPLGLNAFSYYNYNLVGSSLENNVPVYKIKVTPKRPSGKFFKGFLYIADNTYAVKNADLTFEMSFGMANFKIAFDLIEESAVLPTSYQLFADGGLLGSAGWVKSSGSLKYSNVSIIGRRSKPTPKPVAVDANAARIAQEKRAAAERKKEEQQAKRQAKIDALMNKTAMSKSDMNKLAKLVKAEEEAKRPDTLKTLELRGLDKVDFSDDFNQKDSSYWTNLRPIPLEEEEKEAFVKVDSVKSFKDRIAAFENLTRTGEKVTPLALATGGYLYRGKGLDIKTKGFFNPNYTYFNPIDGFTVGNRFAIFKDLSGSRELTTYLIPMYSFNRNRLMGVGHASYLLFPRRMAWLTVGGTYASRDLNIDQPVQPLVNSVTSLLMKDSYTRAMDVRGGYVKLTYEVANGLTAEGIFSYYDRKLVSNSTNFSFLKRSSQYDENIPVNEYLSTHPLTDHKQASLEASLTYTPVQYYRMDGERKRYVKSDYPTFQLLYRRGILDESASQYTLLKAASWKRWDLGFLSELWYKVEGGTFLNSKKLQLPDFYFPKVDYTMVTLQPTKQSFHLIPFYRFATPGWFVEGHMLYEADNIIIKQLPFFKGTVYTENIYLSYFNSKQLRNYVEIGYGIDKIFVLMEIKGIVGFEDGKFRSVGLSISFNRD